MALHTASHGEALRRQERCILNQFNFQPHPPTFHHALQKSQL